MIVRHFAQPSGEGLLLLLRKELDQRQMVVRFNRKPAIGSGNEPRPAHTLHLIGKLLLLLRRQVLDDGIGIDDVETPVAKGESASIEGDGGNPGETAPVIAQFFEIWAAAGYALRPWVAGLKLHLEPGGTSRSAHVEDPRACGRSHVLKKQMALFFAGAFMEPIEKPVHAARISSERWRQKISARVMRRLRGRRQSPAPPSAPWCFPA